MSEQDNRPTPPAGPTGIGKFLQPRFLLLVWLGLGGLLLAFILVNAMIPKGRPGAQGPEVSRQLLTGEMRDFTPSFPPRGAPQVAFRTPDGEATIGDFRGQVVLVNLWATWCAPCLEELPSLDTLQAELGGDDFRVIAIAVEPRAEEKALRFFEQHDIDYLTLYSDPLLSFATTLGGADRLPVSILYDSKGREVGRLTGSADWSSPEATALIRAVIDGADLS